MWVTSKPINMTPQAPFWAVNVTISTAARVIHSASSRRNTLPGRRAWSTRRKSLPPTARRVPRRVTHTWSQPAAGARWPLTQPETQAGAKPNDPHVTETVTTLFDVTPNLVSKQTFGYDQYNNQTDVYKYDFGIGPPGPLIRRNNTDYVTLNNGVDYAADTNIHIRNLPLQKQVFDAGGTKRAESTSTTFTTTARITRRSPIALASAGWTAASPPVTQRAATSPGSPAHCSIIAAALPAGSTVTRNTTSPEMSSRR